MVRASSVASVGPTTRALPPEGRFDDLVNLTRWRADADPTFSAFVLLDGEGREAGSLTFEALDRRARAIAARLQALGAAGERVLLLYPTSLGFVEAFFGCLYAGAVAVPVYPPGGAKLAAAVERLSGIVRDATPRVMLMDRAAQAGLRRLKWGGRVARPLSRLRAPRRFASAIEDVAAVDLSAVTEPEWLVDADVPDAEAAGWRPPSPKGSDVAYLQYTSGSTGDPKGAIITHASALANVALGTALIGAAPGQTGVGWVPLYHDLGLVCGVLGVPYLASRSVLMSPLDFLAKPASWLGAIERYRAELAAGPNFAFDLCVQKTTEEERAAMDLSSWSIAGNGGEPVRPETLERFAKAFAPAGFRKAAFLPTFGAAEATLFVTAQKPADRSPVVLEVDGEAYRDGRVVPTSPASDRGGARLTSCGRAGPGHEVAIVDPEGPRRLPEDAIGEIWYRGPSVCGGYHRRPDADAALFGALPGAPERWLRTGDLGFLHDGELFVTGRRKDLIIHYGRNYYPHDLERSAERAVPEIRPGCSAAFSVTEEGDEEVVLVAELRRRDSAAEAVAHDAAAAISAEHGLAVRTVVLLPSRSIPKTSSGKIRRAACKAAYLAGELPALATIEVARLTRTRRDAPGTAALDPEALVRAEIAALLDLDSPDDVAPEQSLLALGFDSMMAVELRRRLAEESGVDLPMTVVFDHPTPAALARFLGGAGGRPVEPAAASVPPSARVTEGQRAFLEQDRLLPGSFQNIYAYDLEGDVDPGRIAAALEAAGRRFCGLRCAVAAGGLELHDALHPSAVEAVRRPERLVDPGAHVEAAAKEHLDLTQGPVRWRLFTGGGRGLLTMRVAHIAYDARTVFALQGAVLERLEADDPGAVDLVVPDAAYYAAEQAYLASPARAEEVAFFEAEAARGAPDPGFDPEAPLVRIPMSPLGSYAALARRAQAEESSVSSLLMAAFAAAAAERLGLEAFPLGMMVDLRLVHGADGGVPCAVATVPVRYERGVPVGELHRRVFASAARARVPNASLRAAFGLAQVQPALMFHSYLDLPRPPGPAPRAAAGLRARRRDTASIRVRRPNLLQGFVHRVDDHVLFDGRARFDPAGFVEAMRAALEAA